MGRSPSLAIFGVQTWALALNRQIIRAGDKRYGHKCVPVVGLVQWGLVYHYPSPYFSKVPEKLLLVSSPEKMDLVPKT
jgi:hypothetical protein